MNCTIQNQILERYFDIIIKKNMDIIEAAGRKAWRCSKKRSPPISKVGCVCPNKVSKTSIKKKYEFMYY